MGFLLPLTFEFNLLTLCAAVCATLWTYCYIEVIRVGLRDKTCAMPIEALAFNFAWEVLFGIVWFCLEPGHNLQAYVNIVWGLFDCAILYTFFRYGMTRGVGNLSFRSYGAACVAFAFAIMGAAMWHDYPRIDELHAITAWLVNAVMSLMFIRLLWSRGPGGQNMRIAWSKALGTFAVTVAFTFPGSDLLTDHNYPVIVATGWGCFAFDLAYIALLRRALREVKS